MFRRLLLLSASAAALGVFFPCTAWALPGQSVSQFKAWAAGKPLLHGLETRRDETSAFPQFHLLQSERGVAWEFLASTDGKTVVSEQLALSTNGRTPGSEAVRRSGGGYGFTFFKRLYGDAVAADFKASRLVVALKDATNGSVTTFYRGKRYGYATTGGAVTIETFSQMKAAIALFERCARNPASCSE